MRRLSNSGSQASGDTRCSRDCEYTHGWSVRREVAAAPGVESLPCERRLELSLVTPQ